MTTTGEVSLQIKDLPEDAKEKAIACGKRIWQEKNQFKRIGDDASGQYDVYSDNEGLVEITGSLVKSMKGLMEDSDAAEIRITAIRFSESATVPVKAGSSVDLIPVYMISNTASISKKKLELGQYVHLTAAAPVEPGFICLLILSQ